MKSKFLLACVCLSLADFGEARLFAQSAETVSMRIDFVAWGDSISGLSLKGGESQDSFTARAFRYSEPVLYRGPRVLAIYKSADNAEAPVRRPMLEDDEIELIPLSAEEIESVGNASGNSVPSALAERRTKEPTLVSLVTLPANASRATVLLAPAAQGTYQSYVIDDDPSKLPLGKLRIHNLSPRMIAMRLNQKVTTKITPGESFLVDAPKGRVIYELAYRNGEEWKVQENNLVPVSPEEQTQCIVLEGIHSFFLSSDRSSSGKLQTVILRRRTQSASEP